MEPLEYCEKYVENPKPGERGYRAACVRSLTEATFGAYSNQTIDKNWGAQFERRPEAVVRILQIAHTINSVCIKLEEIQPAIDELLEEVSQVAPCKRHK